MSAPEIPDDLMRIAMSLADDTLVFGYTQGVLYIARALMAERLSAAALQREKDAKDREFWQRWAAKRLEISRKFWLRAAKRALDGDMSELRNRVELTEAGPVEIVLSDAAAIREG